jgi:DNA transformation protein and related proteins
MPKRNDDDGFTTHIVDLLKPWCDVEPRRMFSGVGLFANGLMFAIIFDDMLFLKDSKDENGKPIKTPFKKEYVEYERQGKTIQLGYFQAPGRALDDSRYLIELAKASYQSASKKRRPVKSKAPSKSRSKSASRPTAKPATKPKRKPPPEFLKNPFL